MNDRNNDEANRQRTADQGVRFLGCFAVVATLLLLLMAFPAYVLSGDIWLPIGVLAVGWAIWFSVWSSRR